jgi:PIN domain nuclease of toxin-antitoxin system
MNRAITDLGATILPIRVEYANVQAGLPNRDPFDRMLIAQAQSDAQKQNGSAPNRSS